MCVHSHPHFFGVLFWIVPSGTAFISLNSIGFLLHFTIIHSETVSSVVSVLTCQSSGFKFFFFIKWMIFPHFICPSVAFQCQSKLLCNWVGFTSAENFPFYLEAKHLPIGTIFFFFKVCSMTKVHAAYLNPIFAQLCLIFGSRSSRVLS